MSKLQDLLYHKKLRYINIKENGHKKTIYIFVLFHVSTIDVSSELFRRNQELIYILTDPDLGCTITNVDSLIRWSFTCGRSIFLSVLGTPLAIYACVCCVYEWPINKAKVIWCRGDWCCTSVCLIDTK